MTGRRPRVAVVVFPGSNDDRDAADALAAARRRADARLARRREQLPAVDAVVLPGGFSYGDYLRCGAIARFAPAMASVIDFARAGRARARDLQRLPDPVRGGLASGCAAAERLARVRLSRRPARGRANGHPVHLAVRPGTDADDPCEARRRVLAPRPRSPPVEQSSSATPAGRIRTARSTTSPALSTTAGT